MFWSLQFGRMSFRSTRSIFQFNRKRDSQDIGVAGSGLSGCRRTRLRPDGRSHRPASHLDALLPGSLSAGSAPKADYIDCRPFEGENVRHYLRSYSGDKNASGYYGGVLSGSAWLRRSDILQFLEKSGFSEIEIAFEARLPAMVPPSRSPRSDPMP